MKQRLLGFPTSDCRSSVSERSRQHDSIRYTRTRRYIQERAIHSQHTFQLKLYLHEERVNGKGFPLGAERNHVFSTHCRTLS